MSFFIFVLIVVGICWYLKEKKGIPWSKSLGVIGIGIASIVTNYVAAMAKIGAACCNIYLKHLSAVTLRCFFDLKS